VANGFRVPSAMALTGSGACDHDPISLQDKQIAPRLPERPRGVRRLTVAHPSCDAHGVPARGHAGDRAPREGNWGAQPAASPAIYLTAIN
jgi:hypothetical protein